jgi:hypothetical protein
VVSITPGAKFRPVSGSNLQVGAGVSFPLLDETEFDVQALVSVFYHF